MYRLTSIQVPRFLSYFHPVPNIRASPPSRSRLTSIQVTWIASQLHHSLISPYPGLKMCITSQSRSDLTPIQVWRCASQPHPCSVPPPSRSLDSHITYIQVAFQLNPGPIVCISHPSRWCITSFLASQLDPGHISRSSRFKIVCHTSIQVLSHLHPGPNNLISPPCMSQHHPGGEPTKVKCNYIWANVITFVQM